MQTDDLLDRWGDRTTFPAAGHLRCGVSGGADSLALMALAKASGLAVTAVHVDHGQRPGGAEEAAFVKECATAVGAAFEASVVSVDSGSNLDARMRAGRYEVLGPQAATGHTMDDQAETGIINLVRGSGIRGLGAMAPGHRRPILGLRRADTEAVCQHLGWTPFGDPSNSDSAFQRNRIRHEVVPLLNQIAGRDVVPLLARTAAHARSASFVIDEAATSFDVQDAIALAAAPAAVAAAAIQSWLQEMTDSTYRIDTSSVERVLEVARGESVATEVTGGFRVCRSKQRLRVELGSDD